MRLFDIFGLTLITPHPMESLLGSHLLGVKEFKWLSNLYGQELFWQGCGQFG